MTGTGAEPSVHVIDPANGTAPSPFRYPRRRARWLSVAGPVLTLALWEALSRTHAIDPRFFPPPSAIALALVRLVGTGALMHDTLTTLWRVMIGFALGATAGILVGLVMGLSPLVRALLYPVFAAAYPIPKIAILPLVMLIFGMGNISKIVVVAVSVFFLLLFNTLTGVVSIPTIYLDVGRSFGARRWAFYRTIALPGSLPLIFTGLKLGLGVGLIVVVAAEFVASNQGLGYLIWQSWQTFRISSMYVGLALVSLLGFLLSLLFDQVERRIVPWRW